MLPFVLAATDGGATIRLPAVVPTAVAIAAVLTAIGLLWRYVGRPITAGVRFVRDRLDDIRVVVDQLRDVVQYVGLFGADVEARLDRLERRLELGPYHPERRHPPPPVDDASAIRSLLAERLRVTQAIRDLGDDEP